MKKIILWLIYRFYLNRFYSIIHSTRPYYRTVAINIIERDEWGIGKRLKGQAYYFHSLIDDEYCPKEYDIEYIIINNRERWKLDSGK